MRKFNCNWFTLLLIINFSVVAEEQSMVNHSEEPSNKYQGISTVAFSSVSFYPKRTAPAKVEALNVSKIPVEISAKIISIGVKPGEHVLAEAILAELDCRDYNSQSVRANAKLEQTKKQLRYETTELKRAKKVAKKSSLSESEVERRQTVVDNLEYTISSDQASLDIAKHNQSRCKVVAPFNGLVSQRIANVGEMLAPGSAVVELIQLTDMEVAATISISDLESFKGASDYFFHTNNHSFPLKLRSIFNFISNNSSSQKARFKFLKNSAVIGSTGRLQWHSPDLHLPPYLLSSRNGNSGIFVEKQGIATFVTVENVEEGRPFTVNLLADDKIIIDGRHALNVNQKLVLKSSVNAEKDDE